MPKGFSDTLWIRDLYPGMRKWRNIVVRVAERSANLRPQLPRTADYSDFHLSENSHATHFHVHRTTLFNHFAFQPLS
jgi:hypothetical protein